MKKLLLGAAFRPGSQRLQWRQVPGPHPIRTPNAPAHTGTACSAVLTHNPNTGPFGHELAVGAAHLGAVGAAMCGL